VSSGTEGWDAAAYGCWLTRRRGGLWGEDSWERVAGLRYMWFVRASRLEGRFPTAIDMVDIVTVCLVVLSLMGVRCGVLCWRGLIIWV
jgi:hypothetical protein